MKTKTLLLMAVAISCGLVAMLGVQQAMSGNKTQGVQETANVLVAVQEISAGIPIDDATVSFKEMPIESVPPGAVTKPEQYQNRALKVKIFPGEIILQAKLGEEGVFAVARDIPEGMRLVTIPVNSTSAVAGFIQPGDRVDIQVTYKSGRGRGQIEKTKTVLEYIEVFAADKSRTAENSEDSASLYKNISVLLTPEQVHILRLASSVSKGRLNMSLRNPNDHQHVKADDFTFLDLDGIASTTGSEAGNKKDVQEFLKDDAKNQEQQAPVGPEKTKPKNTWTIVIYNGDDKLVEEIPLPEEAESSDSQSETPGNPAATKPVAS